MKQKQSQLPKASAENEMPRRPSLFWDVDPKTIDPQKHASYIIERILEFGRDEDVRWLVHHYTSKVIKDVLRRPRSVLHEKTKALWSLIYQ